MPEKYPPLRGRDSQEEVVEQRAIVWQDFLFIHGYEEADWFDMKGGDQAVLQGLDRGVPRRGRGAE